MHRSLGNATADQYDADVQCWEQLQALAAEKAARKWNELLARGRNVGYAVLGTVAAILTGLGTILCC